MAGERHSWAEERHSWALKDLDASAIWGGWGREECDPTKDLHVQSFGRAGFTVEAGEGPLTLRPAAGGRQRAAQRSQEGPASSFCVSGSPRQEAMRGILDVSW